jgi:hypothetical protein
MSYTPWRRFTTRFGAIAFRPGVGASIHWMRSTIVMSMELWVFSDRQLNSIGEWQAAVDGEGYPLRLSADVSFETLYGFLPCYLRVERTRFENYHDDAGELIRCNPRIHFDHEWKYAPGFRWLGSKVNEARAAWMAATAYAQTTGGMIIDDQEARFHNAAEARQVVTNIDCDFLGDQLIIDKAVEEVLNRARSKS